MALKDKVIVVVGGASGIGEATVREAAKAGANVVIADVNDERGREIADETGTRFVHLDVRSMQEWEKVLGEIVNDLGGLDILHISAAVLTRPASVPVFDDTVPWLTEENWRKVCGINTDGVIFGTIAAIPHLEARGGGTILLGMSGAGYGGWPVDPYYSASKAAVNSWMQAMSALLAPKGIKVNTVDPGAPTDGGMPSVDYREMGLPLQDPNVVGRGIVGVMEGESTGVNWVQSGEGPMVDQAELRAAQAAGGGASTMSAEAQAKLSGRA